MSRQKKPPKELLATRVSADLLARVDALASKMSRTDTNLSMLLSKGQFSRSAVVRLALLRGLESLEAEYADKS